MIAARADKHEPFEFLLFSSVSVVIAYVHQLTIFMIVPIFNSMARIDKRVVEAALDAGASRFDIMRMIILPLSKNGIALGSIFVVSIVMGDFFVIKVMSGGGSASVVGALYEDVGVLQYPSAAASAVVLTIVVTILMVADPADRRCPQGARAMNAAGRTIAAPVPKAVTAHAIAPRASGRPWTFYVLCTVFVLYVIALYGPMICIYILSFQDVRGGLVFPLKGLLAALVHRPVHPGAHRRRQGRIRTLGKACRHGHGQRP